jgi:hypothetical protein
MKLPRQQIVRAFRRAGLPELAEAALKALPETVDAKVLDQFCAAYGISRASLVERMGGSP